MTTVVLDTFTDTNGTGLNSHTPDTDTVGSGWIDGRAAGGGGTIQGNQLQLDTDSEGHVIDSGESDCDVEVDWTPAVGVNNRNSVLFRWQDVSNFWRFNVREPNGDAQLTEVFTVRANTSFTWSEGTTYALRANANGTAIECFIDEVSKLTYTSSSYQTETHHGLYRDAGDNASRFDNFQVDTLVVGGATIPVLIQTNNVGFDLYNGTLI